MMVETFVASPFPVLSLFRARRGLAVIIIDDPFPGLPRQQQRYEAFDPVATFEDDLAHLRVRQHRVIGRLMLPEAHLEADRASIEIGPPDAIEEFHRIALPLLHAAEAEIAALKMPRDADDMRVEDLVMAENVGMRIQHGAEEIAAGSGCIEDDESHHIGEVSHRPLH